MSVTVEEEVNVSDRRLFLYSDQIDNQRIPKILNTRPKANERKQVLYAILNQNIDCIKNAPIHAFTRYGFLLKNVLPKQNACTVY